MHARLKLWADIAIRIRVLIRIWANQRMPAIPIWAARMRRGSPYMYGLRKITHTRMGKIRVWDGTYTQTPFVTNDLVQAI